MADSGYRLPVSRNEGKKNRRFSTIPESPPEFPEKETRGNARTGVQEEARLKITVARGGN